MLIALLLALGAPDAPTNLQLICGGMGAQDKFTFPDDPNHNARYTETVIEDVRIDIAGNTGRIRVPTTMLPKIRGGKDGWFPLSDVVATRDEITAKASMNPFNRLNLKLDRVTGGLAMTVLHGQYRGHCERYTDDTPRAF